MTKTNAQRQAEYRRRHFKDIDGELERINLAVSVTTKRKLERLAVCYGVTQRALLENILAAEERLALEGMTGDEQEAYYSLRRNTPKTLTQNINTTADKIAANPVIEPPALAQGAAAVQPESPGIQNSPAAEPIKYKGVSIHKRSGKYQAQVRINGKPKHLGLFNTPEKANEARLAYLAKRDAVS